MSTSSLQWVRHAYVVSYGGGFLLPGRAGWPDLFGPPAHLLDRSQAFSFVASARGWIVRDGSL